MNISGMSFQFHSSLCKVVAGGFGCRLRLGELRGLPKDSPSISPTSWVNKISLLPTDSSIFPAQAPRCCRFSLGISSLKPARSIAISSVHPLPITCSEPQNLSHLGAGVTHIHIDMKGGRGMGGMERGISPLLYDHGYLHNTRFSVFMTFGWM